MELLSNSRGGATLESRDGATIIESRGGATLESWGGATVSN